MENSSHTSQFENICCLVVDDDRFSRSFIKTALFQIGIKDIKDAANAEEAHEILTNFKIDLILLDQIMPEQSGIEFAQSLGEKHPEQKDIPIIMITVDTQEKTVLDAKNAGIKEYLVKPISPISLKQRITNALHIREHDDN